ncbi:hypothetical protein LCGC14_3151870 [marine sediment metagenome]|uniref:Uncharacterized protein n=1 Tax=marine sediment metagenome TaxID=412755 RepID=A0A0F8VTW3_9ZZZZ
MTVSASMLGNQNARRGRECRDALRRVLAQYKDKDAGIKMGQALYAIYKKLVGMALDGDEFAIREIGNRIDGKPVQVQEIYQEINASWVIATFRAKLGDDEKTRDMLKAAGAENLLPVLDQLIIEQPKVIEHESA